MTAFNDEQREIYRAVVGGVDRRFDPMAVWRRLYTALDSSDLNAALKATQSEDSRERVDAGGRLASWSREAFGLEPLSDSGGVTEREAVTLLYGLFEFEARLKNEPARMPSGAEPSGPSPASSISSDGTASGSIADESRPSTAPPSSKP